MRGIMLIDRASDTISMGSLSGIVRDVTAATRVTSAQPVPAEATPSTAQPCWTLLESLKIGLSVDSPETSRNSPEIDSLVSSSRYDWDGSFFYTVEPAKDSLHVPSEAADPLSPVNP